MDRIKYVRENKYFIFDRPYDLTIENVIKKFAKFILASKYAFDLLLNRKNTITDKKYKVSICAIFKDESSVLREWIEYHLIVGVEHFYLYNNDSIDNYKEILDPYINKGIVTLIEWPGKQRQISAYEDSIEQYSGETNWMGFIDLDEFVVPIEHENIYKCLENFQKFPALLIYWKVFGTSGLIKQDPNKIMIEQFFMVFPKMNDIGKCFYNTEYVYAKENSRNSIMHHILWCKQKNKLLPPVNCEKRVSFSGHNILHNKEVSIQINHYVTKSYIDYYRKVYEKTDVYFQNNPRSIENLYRIDEQCTEADFKIFKFITQLKINMNLDNN